MHMADKTLLKITRQLLSRNFISKCIFNEYRGIKISPTMGLYSKVARYIRNVSMLQVIQVAFVFKTLMTYAWKSSQHTTKMQNICKHT